MPPLQLVASPVRELLLPSASSAARRVFVKCDELAQLVAPCGMRSGVTGVKARKLAALAGHQAFPRHIVSHGGCQSNMMLALARLVRARGPSPSSAAAQHQLVQCGRSSNSEAPYEPRGCGDGNFRDRLWWPESALSFLAMVLSTKPANFVIAPDNAA